MIYAGIDPGSRGAAAVLEDDKLLAYHYENNTESGLDAQIATAERLAAWLGEFQPEIIGLEQPVFNRVNARSHFLQSAHFGVIYHMLGDFNVFVVNPQLVKALVGGKDKEGFVIPYVLHSIILPEEVARYGEKKSLPKYAMQALCDAICIGKIAKKEIQL